MITDEQYALLDLLAETNSSNKTVEADEILSDAYFIFYDQVKFLESALEILDQSEEQHQSAVKTICHDMSTRKYWKVTGFHDAEYLCFGRSCTCPFYMNTLRSSNSNRMQPVGLQVVCKHLIAVRLATSLHKIEVVKLPMDKFMLQMVQERGHGQQSGIAFSTPHSGSKLRK
jgi:predicted nucleic acid-binding Zn finger protein